MLQSRLLGEKNQWSDAVRTWRRLQRELECPRRRNEALGVKTRQEEENEEDSPSGVVQRRKGSGGPNESKVQGVEEPSGPGLMLVKKRKRDNDEEEEEERTIPAQDHSDEKQKTSEGRNRSGLDLMVSCCEGKGVISTEGELVTPLHRETNIKSVDAVADGGPGRKATTGKNLSGFYFIFSFTFLQFHLFLSL